MKRVRPYKHVFICMIDGRKIFTDIDKEVLSEINRRSLSLGIRKKNGSTYATVVGTGGSVLADLQVFTYDLLARPLEQREDGDEIHHRDVDPLNNRYENLERKNRDRHRLLHRVMSEKQSSVETGDLWRPPPSPSPCRRVSVFKGPKLASQDRPRFVPHEREMDLFKATLRANLDRFFDMAEAVYAGRGSPIPRKITSGSFFDRKSRAAGVKPIRYGCLAEEAALVYLLAVFPEKKTALAVLNKNLPQDVEMALADISRAQGGNAGDVLVRGFSTGLIERFTRNRPAVWKAMNEVRRFRRLPSVGGYWHPTPMRKTRD